MRILTGRQTTALKVALYGPEGIGKTTFASQFPKPLFIDTEGSTKHLDVARLERPASFAVLLEQVRWFRNDGAGYQTLVLDTADWAEQLCAADLCARSQKKGIEDFGYGKGYTYLGEDFAKLLKLLEEVTETGRHAVVTAHAKLRKFEQPDELGAYDRWELKLQRTTAPLLKEWADMVLFANYKTYAVKTGEGRVKAQGGKRVMYTSHHPCWDAKNRHGLAEELPFSFEEIRSCVELRNTACRTQRDAPTVGNEMRKAPPAGGASAPATDRQAGERPWLKPLYDLMEASGATAEEVEAACVAKGCAPQNMPLADYPEDFVTGCLVGAWEQVLSMILENRPLPF